MKFELFEGSTEQTSISAISAITVSEIPCTAAVVQTVTTAASNDTVTLRYDVTAGQFIYNWRTPQTSQRCYDLRLTTTCGATKVAHFLTK